MPGRCHWQRNSGRHGFRLCRRVRFNNAGWVFFNSRASSRRTVSTAWLRCWTRWNLSNTSVAHHRESNPINPVESRHLPCEHGIASTRTRLQRPHVRRAGAYTNVDEIPHRGTYSPSFQCTESCEEPDFRPSRNSTITSTSLSSVC